MRRLAARAWQAVAIAALIILSASSAPAQVKARTASLHLEVDEGLDDCLHVERIGESVDCLLGRITILEQEGDVQIHGRVQGRDAEYLLTLTLISDGQELGRRELLFPAEACDESEKQTALVIALLIDPNAFQPPAMRPPPTFLPPRLKAEQPGPVPPTDTDAILDEAQSPHHFGAAVGLPLGFGMLPSVATGARVRAWAASAAIGEVAVEGTTWITQSGFDSTSGAELSLQQASVWGCPFWSVHRSDVGTIKACAGLVASLYSARGFALDRNADDTAALLNPQLGIMSAWEVVGPLRAGASGDLGLPLEFLRLVYQDEQVGEVEIYSVPRIVGSATLWVGLER